MKTSSPIKRYFIGVLTLILSCSFASGFPPAPHFTIYGVVRDEVGQRIPGNGETSIILLKDGVQVAKSPLVDGMMDFNYELKVKVDAGRSGTDSYIDSAYLANELLVVAVEINGQLYYPIEVSQEISVGEGSERLRLDLNLGEDSDLDGLPDAWEQWQLYFSGEYPNGEGEWNLDLLSPDGDFDQDGQSDLYEYIAGTFASDSTQTFNLTIKHREEGVTHFEFYQITGKRYVLEHSTDAVHWLRVPFTVEQGAVTEQHRAQNVGVVSAQAFSTDRISLYRLIVR